MILVKEFLFGLLATIGFSVLFNTPKDSVFKTGFIGALGWTVYFKITLILTSPIVGAFLGALTVALAGEFFARLFKKPATIFIIPGIVPLVPGSGMYYTMLAIIENRFIDASNLGSETFFVGASIASGIIISSSIGKVFKKRRRLL